MTDHIDDAAGIFKALADPARLRTLILLKEGPRSVGEITDTLNDNMGAVSARLKVLMQARLVARERDGKSMIYSIADHHVISLVENAIDHAAEDHA
jgi:ArsR family transcriptional regulator